MKPAPYWDATILLGRRSLNDVRRTDRQDAAVAFVAGCGNTQHNNTTHAATVLVVERSAAVQLAVQLAVLLVITVRMLRSTGLAIATRAWTKQRCLLSTTAYSPTLTEARVGEMGTGGRSSEAGLKVALFGASGFLGNYVCGELGTLAL